MGFFGNLFSADNGAERAQEQELIQSLKGQVEAIGKVMAVIEFNLDGTILTANQNFLNALGYSLGEIQGQHHRMFVDAAERETAEYRRFWEKLSRGEFDAAQYKRIGKGGKEIWIQASYNPIMDAAGRPYKVVKYATDITEQKQKTADFEGQLAAINKAMAVIEFTLDGRILNANENFLNTLGYSASEVNGQHHSLFVTPAYQNSPEYKAFWAKLGRGEYDAGQYLRLGKGGKEVWIQASYNPIMDMNGRPFKVVKYATDITEQVKNNQAMKLTVEQTQHVVGAAIEGDLTQRIPMDGKSGALRELCDSVNSLVENMFEVIALIKESSDSVTTAAGEIAAGNSDLSQRTEEQASSLEETASSMEELTSTVKQNADNAKQANLLAVGASDVAAKGGAVVGQVVQTMGAINESSRKIVDIISVIDSIAFQTNILALNAAVEAARAGEQGRGFAVVAAEVRTLAQRSASAAKEIKELIGDSVDKVDAGARLVGEAGQTMEEIVASIRQVTHIMSEISSASAEQSSGIEQVNRAITQMEEVVQQNAALVEEASAASESLRQQAVNMSDTVGRFHLGDGGSVSTPIARKPASVSRSARPAPVARPASRPAAKPVAKSVAKPAAKPAAVSSRADSDDDWAEF